MLVDRYHYSGMVYSAAKQNPALPLAWARKPDEGLPRPDACIFLEVAPDVAAARAGFGGERYENAEMQERVKGLFRMVRGMPEGEDIVVVDGGQEFESVEQEVNAVVARVVSEMETNSRPLRRVMPWPE